MFFIRLFAKSYIIAQIIKEGTVQKYQKKLLAKILFCYVVPRNISKTMKFLFCFGVAMQFLSSTLSASKWDHLEISQMKAGLFSSGGFGSYGGDKLRGGYTNLFGSVSVEIKDIYGFNFGLGGSVVGLLHKVKNHDIYSDISNDEIGIGFRINNDEAKDFRYTSDPAILHTLYMQYQNSWGNIIGGRFPLKLEWIGDYVEGVAVDINKFEDWEIRAGWFDRQAYADEQENVHFGYIKHWYEKYEGYKIDNNYFLDLKYTNDFLALNLYYNYFDTLLSAFGLKTNWNFGYGDWKFDTLLQYVLVSSSKQSQDSCSLPSVAAVAGIACYIQGSMGSVWGYLLQLQQDFAFRDWYFSLGYLQNDNKNSTNNLPIYSDENPLEYNTVIYGGGAKTGYMIFRYEYNKRYFLSLKYAQSYYHSEGEIFSQGQFNALAGADFSNINISLAYININDKSGYKNNIARIWLGFRF